ncbi:MAG: hypothetical protein N2112_02860 [Gemmataceae bacterium]|nr:hypothetical protein [Gemmataceae bacterium]
MRLLAITLTLLCTTWAMSEEKALKPKGVYERSISGIELVLDFAKDNLMVMTLKGDGKTAKIDVKYTEKDGTYQCEITNVEDNDGIGVKPKGYKFSFKLKTAEKKVTLSDLDGEDISGEVKSVLEGDYEKK